MAQANFVLPLLLPERQLVCVFPTPYNELASPYEQQRDFSKVTRAELAAAHCKWPLRPCKVIFVGDVAVGKTTMVNRFCYDKFQRSYKATIGVDFEIENFNILGQNFSLEMWDTAGQERFKCIAQGYYRNANVIVIVFDMTKPETLQSATTWLNSALAVNTMQKPLIFLVGTKSDLLSRQSFISMEKSAAEMAEGIKAEYWSVSARTGYNVVSLFQRMAALAFETSFREALMEREYRKRSISIQTCKKSQTLDFRHSFGCNKSCGEKKRSFCLC